MHKWPRCGHSRRICIFYYAADMQIRIRKSSLALSDKFISAKFNYSATKPFIFFAGKDCRKLHLWPPDPNEFKMPAKVVKSPLKHTPTRSIKTYHSWNNASEWWSGKYFPREDKVWNQVSVNHEAGDLLCFHREPCFSPRKEKNSVINIHVEALAVIYSKNVLQLDSVFVFRLWNTT